MFIEQFSENSRNILINSRLQAVSLGNKFIDTEHLLLSLLIENNTAVKIIKNLYIDPDEIYKETKKVCKINNFSVNDIPFSNDARDTLQMAIESCNSMGYKKVSTAHILIALIKGLGVSSKILEKFNITYDEIEYEYNKLNKDDKKEENIKTEFIDKYTVDITKKALRKQLDPVIGREKEIERLIQILCRRTKSNAILIGESGVGKTAIVEGLAQKIVNNKVPEILCEKKLISLNLGSLISGTKFRGMFEDRITNLLKDILKRGNIILFIDEIHTIVGAGSSEGSLDTANLLKPSLSRGEIQCIGATTIDEYRKYIEKDKALERRFQTIKINEPTINETRKIINGIKSRYEKFHNVVINKSVIDESIRLSNIYITDRNLPDKVIDIIDEACSYAKIKSLDKRNKLNIVIDNNTNYKKLKEMRNKEKEIKNNPIIINEDHISNVISNWTNIPVGKLKEQEVNNLMDIEKSLQEKLINQEQAIKGLVSVIKQSKLGIRNLNKPIGSFIFLGPSGVGKTELVKCLSEYLFKNRNSIIRLDMSEYSQEFSISRLIGSPPGYVGYEESGQLTEKVRRNPYSILLLDEIEKAHHSLFNILLQILDEGYLNDSKGRSINFKNTIIIMTSNISFNDHKIELKNLDGDDMFNFTPKLDSKESIDILLSKVFSAEFLNRIDEVVLFNELNKNDLNKIFKLQLNLINNNLKMKGLTLKIDSEETIDKIIGKTFSKKYGARPLIKYIQKDIMSLVSDEMIKRNFNKGDNIIIKYIDSKINVIKEECEVI